VSKFTLHSFAVAAAVLTILGGTPADAQTAAPAATAAAPQASPLDGAERIGSGRFSAWRKGPQTLVVLPPDALGKPLLWYTEVVAVPSGMVANDGLVRPVSVQAGLSDGMLTEILGGDVKPGDAVVIHAVRKAQPDFVSSFINQVTDRKE
jgi:multidrug efflux pump subunit AcrA (membrane-fusion protein)